MKAIYRACVALLLLSLCLAAPTAAGPREDAAQDLKEVYKAAEIGDAKAQALLGAMYATGQGVPLDYAESEKWSRKAAKQGEAGGQFMLGFMYDTGKGVPKDFAEAVKWYRKAAEQDYATAHVISESCSTRVVV